MNDALEEVLRAIERRAFISPVTAGWPVIALISWRTLSSRNYDSIRHFQATIKERFRIQLITIGGGYGCSKIVFSVEASSHEKASDFVLEFPGFGGGDGGGRGYFGGVCLELGKPSQKPLVPSAWPVGGSQNQETSDFVLRIMKSAAFRKVAGEAEFRVAICQDPYIRTDLRTGGQELSERAEIVLRAMYGETDTGCIKSGNVTNINNVILRVNGDIHQNASEVNLMTGDNFENVSNSMIATRGSIAKGIISVREHKGNNIADALQTIEQALLADTPSGLTDEQRTEALELLAELSHQGAKPEGSKTVMKSIGTALWSIIEKAEPLSRACLAAWAVIEKIWK